MAAEYEIQLATIWWSARCLADVGSLAHTGLAQHLSMVLASD